MELDIKQLAAVVAIIDIACERGAFKGAEMGDIGMIRNNIQQFVRDAQEHQNAPQPAVKDEEPVEE